MTHPTQFRFSGMPASRAAEAAARRRMRALAGTHPGVLGWHVAVDARQRQDAAPADYSADVQVHMAGGDTLRARAVGADVLAALRLAFNELEAQLDAEPEGVPARAARWLSSVKSRLAQRQGFA